MAAQSTYTCTAQELKEIYSRITELQARRREIDRELAALEQRQRAIAEEIASAESVRGQLGELFLVGTMIGANQTQRMIAAVFEAAVAAKDRDAAEIALRLAELHGVHHMWRDADGRSMHVVFAGMEQ
jgi:chromosome segregation ATPase